MLNESIEELSESIIQVVQNWDNQPIPMLGCTLHTAINTRIEWYLNDVFSVIKNMNDTSLDKMDRAQRLIALEEKYGIPKTHTIIKS